MKSKFPLHVDLHKDKSVSEKGPMHLQKVLTAQADLSWYFLLPVNILHIKVPYYLMIQF